MVGMMKGSYTRDSLSRYVLCVAVPLRQFRAGLCVVILLGDYVVSDCWGWVVVDFISAGCKCRVFVSVRFCSVRS